MTLVIAHRGASADEVENTLPAFERALADGADAIELDVQAAADGTPVVHHDATLDRLTPLRGPLRTRTAAELQAVGIPTLDEVIELTRDRIPLWVELKGAWRSRRHDLPARVARRLTRDDTIISYERRALEAARAAVPSVGVLQHVGYGVSITRAATYAWAVGLHDPRLTRRGLRKATDLGLTTTVYTVNDEDRMRTLVALGVGGIFTDRPALLRWIVDGQA
jgi:glycerophosphoryl diester phosphodiesterase